MKEGTMAKIVIKIKTPKARNALALAVLAPQSAFRPKSERDRTKYSRKMKHKKAAY
jgi:hypothetical protein